MPLSDEKKKEAGKKLLNGEDVTLTFSSEGDLVTELSGEGNTEIADGETEVGGGESGGSGESTTHDHHNHHQPEQTGINAELVIDLLAQRAGYLEKELAIKEAVILTLEQRLQGEV